MHFVLLLQHVLQWLRLQLHVFARLLLHELRELILLIDLGRIQDESLMLWQRVRVLLRQLLLQNVLRWLLLLLMQMLVLLWRQKGGQLLLLGLCELELRLRGGRLQRRMRLEELLVLLRNGRLMELQALRLLRHMEAMRSTIIVGDQLKRISGAGERQMRRLWTRFNRVQMLLRLGLQQMLLLLLLLRLLLREVRILWLQMGWCKVQNACGRLTVTVERHHRARGGKLLYGHPIAAGDVDETVGILHLARPSLAVVNGLGGCD